MNVYSRTRFFVPSHWRQPVTSLPKRGDRANSCPTCRDTPVFDARCPCPTCNGSGVVHPEFARGMRRAVEIARKLEAELDQYDWFSVGELSEAVAKELADD